MCFVTFTFLTALTHLPPTAHRGQRREYCATLNHMLKFTWIEVSEPGFELDLSFSSEQSMSQAPAIPVP